MQNFQILVVSFKDRNKENRNIHSDGVRSPSIFSLILSRRKYAHTQNFLTFNIYIYDIFWQNFMHVGGCVQNLWPFWDGGLHEE